jgi:hypothetical protein
MKFHDKMQPLQTRLHIVAQVSNRDHRENQPEKPGTKGWSVRIPTLSGFHQKALEFNDFTYAGLGWEQLSFEEPLAGDGDAGCSNPGQEGILFFNVSFFVLFAVLSLYPKKVLFGEFERASFRARKPSGLPLQLVASIFCSDRDRSLPSPRAFSKRDKGMLGFLRPGAPGFRKALLTEIILGRPIEHQDPRHLQPCLFRRFLSCLVSSHTDTYLVVSK